MCIYKIVCLYLVQGNKKKGSTSIDEGMAPNFDNSNATATAITTGQYTLIHFKEDEKVRERTTIN